VSDNPFITPDNPTGRWDMLIAEAAAATSPIGPLAVLRLHFSSSATGNTIDVDVASTPDGMRAIARMIHQTATKAARAAEHAGGAT
jgi:hypothetical protein